VKPPLWTLVATRLLSCEPARGDYLDPGRACHALKRYVALLHHRRHICYCPMATGLQARAVGTVGGHYRRIGLDFCTACGLGDGATRAIAVLTPGAPILVN
jgi:hypothetical protein